MTRDDLPWPTEELIEAIRFTDWDCECGGGDRGQVSDFIRQHPATWAQAYEIIRQLPAEGHRQIARNLVSGFAGALNVLGDAELHGPAVEQRNGIFRRSLTHWDAIIRDEAQSQIDWVNDHGAISALGEAVKVEPNGFLAREMKKTLIRLKRKLEEASI